MISPGKQRLMLALEVLNGTTPRIVAELPLRVASRANDHTSNHWSKRARTSKAHRDAVRLKLATVRPELRKLLDAGLVVRVVRVAPSKGLDGHDNVGMSLKALVDGVADVLGVRDDDARVEFVPDQERGPWGVRVEFYDCVALASELRGVMTSAEVSR